MVNHLDNFKKDGYVLIKNFLSKEMSDFFYYYIKMEAGKRNFLDEINYFKDKESSIYREFGELSDRNIGQKRMLYIGWRSAEWVSVGKMGHFIFASKIETKSPQSQTCSVFDL